MLLIESTSDQVNPAGGSAVIVADFISFNFCFLSISNITALGEGLNLVLDSFGFFLFALLRNSSKVQFCLLQYC